MLDYVIIVNDNGEMKTIRPDDMTSAVQSVIEKGLQHALDVRSARAAKRKPLVGQGYDPRQYQRLSPEGDE